jgi:hypothetical protein
MYKSALLANMSLKSKENGKEGTFKIDYAVVVPNSNDFFKLLEKCPFIVSLDMNALNEWGGIDGIPLQFRYGNIDVPLRDCFIGALIKNKKQQVLDELKKLGYTTIGVD